MLAPTAPEIGKVRNQGARQSEGYPCPMGADERAPQREQQASARCEIAPQGAPGNAASCAAPVSDQQHPLDDHEQHDQICDAAAGKKLSHVMIGSTPCSKKVH